MSRTVFRNLRRELVCRRKMIRVLHLITGLSIGGAERALAQFVQKSDASSFHHVVISMIRPGRVGDELQASGVAVHTLGMTSGVPSVVGVFRLIRLLRRYRPNVLHCWMYHANLLGLFAGKLATVPHILWSIRSSNPVITNHRQLTRGVVKVGAWLSRFPDLTSIVSEAGKELHLACGYEKTRMTVIPNGFDLELFKPDPLDRLAVRSELGISNNVVLIGLVARFDPVKDHKTFMRAAALLSQRMRSVHFLLAGKGVSPDNPELMRVVRENAVCRVVHLLGLRDDVARLMAGLDVACLSSRDEGFPNVIGEAMACDVPCVVTDVGDAAYIVGDTGKVVPTADPTALAAAWGELLGMRVEARAALGRRGRRRIQEKFSLARVKRAYEDLYESSKGPGRLHLQCYPTR